MQRQGQTQGVHGQHLSTYADYLRGQEAGGLKGDRLQVSTNKEENGTTVRTLPPRMEDVLSWSNELPITGRP